MSVHKPSLFLVVDNKRSGWRALSVKHRRPAPTGIPFMIPFRSRGRPVHIGAIKHRLRGARSHLREDLLDNDGPQQTRSTSGPKNGILQEKGPRTRPWTNMTDIIRPRSCRDLQASAAVFVPRRYPNPPALVHPHYVSPVPPGGIISHLLLGREPAIIPTQYPATLTSMDLLHYGLCPNP